MKSVNFLSYKINETSPCFIIAEAGVNHNGSLDIAKKLVDAAKEAGADAVKFQTFKAENLVTKTARMAEYQEKNMNVTGSQYDLLKKLELSEENHYILKEYCDRKNITFCSTPHSSFDDVDFLQDIDVPFFKIASGDLTNLPFLDYVARKQKPIILSTGMGNLQECKEALQTINDAGNKELIFLHCTTCYPCPESLANLNAINTLRTELGTLVGYSDHTLSYSASIIAYLLGAQVIEKHVTLDRCLEGPDHKSSLEPKELSDFVKAVKLIEKKNLNYADAIKLVNMELRLSLKPNIAALLGTGLKEPCEQEIEVAKVARKSIVAAKNLSEGIVLKESDIAFKRPGDGISPKFTFGKYNQVLDRALNCDVKEDEQILEVMLKH